MIRFVSSGIVKWLLDSEAISQQDKELYEYAAYSLLFSIIPLVLVIVVSALMGMLPQGITFVIPFLLLRKFSGGYHLKSPGICFCVSVAVILLFMLAIKHLILANTYLQCIPVVVVSAIQLIVFSPIDSEARELSEKERTAFKRIVCVLTVIFACLFGTTILLGFYWPAICISASVFLTACLQWPCIVTTWLTKRIQ